MNAFEPEHVGDIGSEEIQPHLGKILQSKAFRRSPALRQLFAYLVNKAEAGLSHQIKEQVIGTDVFGRPHDFDSRTDNIVRVQAHRLRKLLITYYLDEGKEDRIQFSIPRGSYVPNIQRVTDLQDNVPEHSSTVESDRLETTYFCPQPVPAPNKAWTPLPLTFRREF